MVQGTHDTTHLYNSTQAKKEGNIMFSAKASTDPNVNSILANDLVFCVGTSQLARSMASKLNNAIPVISSLNGLYVRRPKGDPVKYDDNEEEDDRIKNYKLSKVIRFMGLAVNGTNVSSAQGDGHKTQLTIRTKGTASIVNTGANCLRPGDTLVWALPTSKEIDVQFSRRGPYEGRFNSKVRLNILPRQAAEKNYNIQLLESLGEGNKKSGLQSSASGLFAIAIKTLLFAAMKPDAGEEGVQIVNDKEELAELGKDSGDSDELRIFMRKSVTKELVTRLFAAFTEIQSDMDRRVIGRCLSFGKPGEQIDVLVGEK
jgi:hypothetical protein